jgi:long-chain acyl-CoA synthetase
MHYSELKAAWAELTAPGAQFEVVKAEVRGQQLNVYKNALPNIRTLWLSTAQFADRTYLVYEDDRITYAEAHRIVASVASWMFAQGVRPGDRVAIAMRNYPEWMLIYWACVSCGIACVGMNAWWVPEELDYALKDSRPKVVFADQERLGRIEKCKDALGGAMVVGVRADAAPGVIAWSDVVAHGGELPAVEPDPDDDACIFYTSGTTGFPKGAQLTHRGCIANLFNMLFAGQAQSLATQRATGVFLDPDAPPPVPVALLPTPLFHVTANNCGVYLITAAGGAVVLMYRWEPGEALKLIEREKVTAMTGVPVMSRELIAHPDFDKYDLSTLVSLGGGGSQLQPDLVHKIDKSVATARPQTGYGMTETCGIITSISGDFFVDKPDSAGPAMPTFEVKCVDDEGNTVPVGELGELWVKGSPVIKGYINRPEATAESITDGWLHTGDVARLDADGFIFIVDRKKDMVLRGGENIYCAEVETCIYRLPQVAECCVFGVPDERLGEEVGCAIVLQPGTSLDAEAVRSHCMGAMARHKAPRYIWFLSEAIPRNASGKFLKRQLRDTLKVADAV